MQSVFFPLYGLLDPQPEGAARNQILWLWQPGIGNAQTRTSPY
jgi:hypothetical protein